MTIMFMKNKSRIIAVPVVDKLAEPTDVMLQAIEESAVEPTEDERVLVEIPRDEWLSHFVLAQETRVG